MQPLAYEYIFLLSGTPVYNRWDDLHGQMALLPGCLFTSIEHFHAVFSKRAKASSDDKTNERHPSRLLKPGERHLCLMKRLLALMLVARPKTVLADDMTDMHRPP